MKNLFLLAQIALLTMLCSGAKAYVMTFDDIPCGSNLDYYEDQYNAYFTEGFQVSDHSQSTWGPPHSGNNVLTWGGDISQDAWLSFGGALTSGYSNVGNCSIRSLGAYFSTVPGVLIIARAYNMSSPWSVCTRLIGADDPNDYWNNEYVEFTADDGGVIDYIRFEACLSRYFSVDDITVDPVPEPSSILVLSGGLSVIGCFALRRRRS
jgi:hypothetical protein